MIAGPADLAAIAAWNLRNHNARREYAAHPLTACLGVHRAAAGVEYACPNLRLARDTYCGRCRREAAANNKTTEAREQTRASRDEKESSTR